MQNSSLTWIYLALTITMTSVGQVLLKLATAQPEFQGALQRGPGALTRAALGEPRLLAGVTLYGLATALWLLVLARLDLSLAYSMATASFVLVLVLSCATLGETIGVARLCGAAMIVVGIVFVSRPQVR